MSKQVKKLREILSRSEPLVSMGVWDPYSAIVAEQEGFEVLTIFGSMESWSQIGRPDTGYITQTELVDAARRIVPCVSVPVILDCDDGFGDPINVRRTVQLAERAGVAGLYIEDLSRPLHCSALGGGGLVSADVMVQKIRAAVEAREDPDFFIMARTDGYVDADETIDRSRKYVAAGADMVLVIGFQNPEDLRKIAQTAGVPIATIQAARTMHVFLPHNDLVEMGMKGIFHVQPMFLAAAQAMRDAARSLKADIARGTDVPVLVPGPSPAEIEESIELADEGAKTICSYMAPPTL